MTSADDKRARRTDLPERESDALAFGRGSDLMEARLAAVAPSSG
jgi:hypothetical protein